MVRIVATYRNAFAFGCLLFYVSCTFQPSILESVHFLTHLGEMVQHKYVAHDMDHGDDHSHNHKLIELLAVAFNTTSDTPAPHDAQSSSNLKKLPEMGHDVLEWTDLDAPHSSDFCYIRKKYNTPSINSPSPPPRS